MADKILIFQTKKQEAILNSDDRMLRLEKMVEDLILLLNGKIGLEQITVLQASNMFAVSRNKIYRAFADGYLSRLSNKKLLVSE